MPTQRFVDANHSGDTKTKRSQTGILLISNKTPIIWFRMRQNYVEASTFGSEFTTMNNTEDIIYAFF